MGFDWKKTLGTVAPVLATAFGGPLAGVATKMAAEALGLPTGASESDVAAAVQSGDTQVLVKLKEVEAQFRRDMKALEVDVHRIDAQDRGSARMLATMRGTGPHVILSTVFVGGFFVVFGLFINALFDGIALPQEFVALISALIGIMSAAVTQIMNFWFGSSSGSKEKTQQLAGAIK